MESMGPIKQAVLLVVVLIVMGFIGCVHNKSYKGDGPDFAEYSPSNTNLTGEALEVEGVKENTLNDTVNAYYVRAPYPRETGDCWLVNSDTDRKGKPEEFHYYGGVRYGEGSQFRILQITSCELGNNWFSEALDSLEAGQKITGIEFEGKTVDCVPQVLEYFSVDDICVSYRSGSIERTADFVSSLPEHTRALNLYRLEFRGEAQEAYDRLNSKLAELSFLEYLRIPYPNVRMDFFLSMKRLKWLNIKLDSQGADMLTELVRGGAFGALEYLRVDIKRGPDDWSWVENITSLRKIYAHTVYSDQWVYLKNIEELQELHTWRAYGDIPVKAWPNLDKLVVDVDDTTSRSMAKFRKKNKNTQFITNDSERLNYILENANTLVICTERFCGNTENEIVVEKKEEIKQFSKLIVPKTPKKIERPRNEELSYEKLDRLFFGSGGFVSVNTITVEAYSETAQSAETLIINENGHIMWASRMEILLTQESNKDIQNWMNELGDGP